MGRGEIDQSMIIIGVGSKRACPHRAQLSAQAQYDRRHNLLARPHKSSSSRSPIINPVYRPNWLRCDIHSTVTFTVRLYSCVRTRRPAPWPVPPTPSTRRTHGVDMPKLVGAMPGPRSAHAGTTMSTQDDTRSHGRTQQSARFTLTGVLLLPQSIISSEMTRPKSLRLDHVQVQSRASQPAARPLAARRLSLRTVRGSYKEAGVDDLGLGNSAGFFAPSSHWCVARLAQTWLPKRRERRRRRSRP